jgi:two-component system, LytTR family, response regulator
MKVIIIDDEPLARMLLTEYLQEHSQLQIVAECGDGFEGIKAIAAHNPDLIFLDVQMPKINGFEMLELLENPPAVIFTTAFDQYALKAFEAHAIDYLLKPFSPERLASAIVKACENIVSTQQKTTPLLQTPLLADVQAPRIVVKENHQIHIVNFTDIIYIESADDYVKIYTVTRYYLKKKTMNFYEELLPSVNFCRVHRGFIVDISQIKKVEPWEKDGAIITLHNGKEIPVSKAGYKRLKENLGM